MKKIEFKLKDASGEVLLYLGYLKWPWSIKEIVDHGRLVEIVDAKGTSVVSLDDIRLDDLYQNRLERNNAR